ncbi:MAG: ABC transporter permease [Dehalococcoidia bacterium]
MSTYVARRVVEMVPVLLILSVIVFLVLRLLPGDPLNAFIGQEAGVMTPEQRAVLMEELGLNRPLPVQFADWLVSLLRGDWGKSLISQQPVAALVAARLNITLQLAVVAWLVATALAIPIGVFSALRRNSWLDVGITTGALAGLATPNFLLGLLLIILFSVYLKVLPTSGFVSLTTDPVDALRHLAMPVVALSTGLMASLIRQTRSAMLEVMNEDYIRTARAKGLTPRVVIFRHALKNALLPVVTIAGLQIGNLASGTIIVETIFAIPGMGRLTIDAILIKDFATVQVVVLILALFTMGANLAADLIYVRLDPRIRLR